MEGKVCPVCTARWNDAFNFCPIDATRLVAMSALEAAPRAAAVSSLEAAPRAAAPAPHVLTPAPQPVVPVPAKLTRAPTFVLPDIEAGAARALADSLDALDGVDEARAGRTAERERPKPDIRGPTTTRRRKRVDSEEAAARRDEIMARVTKTGRGPRPVEAAGGDPRRVPVVTADDGVAVNAEAAEIELGVPGPARDASMFSDTEWFRRPVDPARIDPTTLQVQVATDDYRYNDKLPTSERRRFSLRRARRD